MNAVAVGRTMDLGRAFRTVVFLNVLVGLCGFGLANESPVMLAVVSLLSGLGWYFTEVRARTHGWKGLPRWVTAVVLVLLLGLAIVRAWLLQDLVVAFSEFLGGIVVLKLWERRAVRDYGQLITLTLFMTIGATLTTASLTVGAVWAVQLPLMVAGVMMYQVFAARERASLAAAHFVDRHAGLRRGAFFSLLVGVITVGMLISAAIFVIVPRGIGGDEWAVFSSRGGRVTGFSDTVEPGAGELVSTSYATVLEVAFRDPNGPIGANGQYHYLRGAVLEVYDRGIWREPLGGNRSGVNRGTSFGQWLRLDDPSGDWIEQHVTIIGGSRREIMPLFALYKPTAVRLEDPTNPRVRYDRRTGRLQRQGSPTYFTYTVRSSVPEPSPERQSERVPPREPFPSQIVRQVAEMVLRQANIEPDPEKRPITDDERAAHALERYLRGFEYGMDQLRPPLWRDPTEWFLLTAKRGHCEYFASALAGMCRSVGINARVVAGYLANEYDPSRGLYIVRESDAHAWVEVDTGPGGWQIFDATPVVMTRLERQPTAMDRLRRFMASISDYWNTRIVGFDQRRQESLLSPIVSQRLVETFTQRRRELTIWWRSVRLNGRAPAVLATAAGGVALAVGLIWLGVRAWKRRERKTWSVGWAFQGREKRVYRALLAALAERGYIKPAWAPPLVFLREVAARDAALAHRAEAVMHEVYAARFGGRREALAAAERALTELRAR